MCAFRRHCTPPRRKGKLWEVAFTLRSTSMKFSLLLGFFSITLAANVHAIVIDFNREGSTTVAGATGINVSGANALFSNISVSGNVSFTVSSSISTTTADVFNRDRNSATFGPKDSFFEDFVGVTNNAAYTLTFTNLAAGTYTFSSWHYDPGATTFPPSPDAAIRTLLLTDANGTATNLGTVTKPATNTITNLNQLTPFTFQLTSNGTNPVIVTYGGAGSGAFVINGFEINPVPEPGAMGLLPATALLAVFRRRRRSFTGIAVRPPAVSGF